MKLGDERLEGYRSLNKDASENCLEQSAVAASRQCRDEKDD
jgi:hypothetical protein